ncbi:MAG TPA: dephospho-CoA kinase [Candidatus Angelobacter sp.]|jgi:dephospho-CoA kinase|nr:dephospho-CoA kinase [Candidatus Angelobacter sp.]
MLKVGLTGGVACGKSTVAKMFADLGAQVVDADSIAHELYRPGQDVYQELVKRFGQEIVKPDGEIDRAKLAAAAFDGGRVEELNRIVHPAVIRQQDRWMREVAARDPYAVAIVEAALIFEAGVQDRFDKIMVVTCKPAQKVTRFAERTGRNEADARADVDRRSKAQIPDEEKVRQADFVIDNSGSVEETRYQVQHIYGELKVLAKRPVSDR